MNVLLAPFEFAFFARALVAVVLIGGERVLEPWLVASLLERIGSLALLIGVAMVVYFVIVFALGAYTVDDFKRNALRR